MFIEYIVIKNINVDNVPTIVSSLS